MVVSVLGDLHPGLRPLARSHCVSSRSEQLAHSAGRFRFSSRNFSSIGIPTKGDRNHCWLNTFFARHDAREQVVTPQRFGQLIHVDVARGITGKAGRARIALTMAKFDPKTAVGQWREGVGRDHVRVRQVGEVSIRLQARFNGRALQSAAAATREFILGTPDAASPSGSDNLLFSGCNDECLNPAPSMVVASIPQR